ncbi:MAG: hypothetical protein EBR82_84190 [Caulobacteraceae bacterium]|nr:hypothetical protein [Caulobacteraceae bacterium]NDG03559.1 hypothetical protein [Synechococcaceae bacterium WBB_34_004]
MLAVAVAVELQAAQEVQVWVVLAVAVVLAAVLEQPTEVAAVVEQVQILELLPAAAMEVLASSI